MSEQRPIDPLTLQRLENLGAMPARAPRGEYRRYCKWAADQILTLTSRLGSQKKASKCLRCGAGAEWLE